MRKRGERIVAVSCSRAITSTAIIPEKRAARREGKRSARAAPTAMATALMAKTREKPSSENPKLS